jgi:uncharacterized repeat protein (TIGR01451 family)
MTVLNSLRSLSNLRRGRTARGSRRRLRATFLPESLELRLMLSADLAVSEIGPTSVKAGSTATYTVTLSNLGPDPASGVVLTDLLSFSTPNGTFAPSSFSIAPAASDPDSFTAGGPIFTETANAAIASGNTDTFVVTAQIPATVPAGSTVTSAVSVTSTTSDPNLANNSDSVTTNVIPLASDLSVTETGPASVKAGSTATYDITLSNLGPDPASGVVLSDVLNLLTPTGTFTASSFSIAPAAGDPDSFTAGFLPPLGFTETANAAIASGNTDSFVVTCTIPTSVPAGSTVTSAVSVTSTTSDPNLSNNRASVTTDVQNVGVLLLDSRNTTSLVMIGNAKLNAGAESIVADSTSPLAAAIVGNGSITASQLEFVKAPGIVSIGGSIQAPITYGPGLPDPLQLTAPAPGPVQPSGTAQGSQVLTLAPGTYDQGISVSGQATVMLSAGVYYLNGPLLVSGHGKIVMNPSASGGAMIYLAPGSDGVFITNYGSVQTTAMTSGTYANVALFIDRSSAAGIVVSGHGILSTNGSVYAPSAVVGMSDNGQLLIEHPAAAGALIVSDMIVTGQALVDPVIGNSASIGSALLTQAARSLGGALFASSVVSTGTSVGLDQVVNALNLTMPTPLPNDASALAEFDQFFLGDSAFESLRLEWLDE